MHEQSLVRTLLRQVESIRQEHGGRRVTETRVEVGPLSGVEPLLLASAFEQSASETTAADATLVIDEVALLAECEACREQFELQQFDFRCPACRGNVRIVRGDTLQLISVDLQDTEPIER